MKRLRFGYQAIAVMGLSLGLIVLTGCGGGEKPAASTTAEAHNEHDGHDHDGHDHDGHDHDDHKGHEHPSEGPHHGSLVELGNEEYHAEVVHDEAAGTVTIYLLDSAGKSSVPIEAAELLINLSHDGQAEQFALAASPDADDPSGKASRFVSTDDELAEDLDLEGVNAQLVVTIDGKQYRGAIEHDHDDHNHDHDHDNDNHDDHEHGEHDQDH